MRQSLLTSVFVSVPTGHQVCWLDLSYMEREDEVFLDAEEEFAPRRSGRKRRSTAGASPVTSSVKKPRQAKKMPVERSPGRDPGRDPKQRDHGRASAVSPRPPEGAVAGGDDFWDKMGGMLGGMEARMKRETDTMKQQLAAAVDAVGDLGIRMDKTERRLHGLVDEVNSIVDKKLSGLPVNLKDVCPTRGPSYASTLMTGPSRATPEQITAWKTVKSPRKRKEEHYWECRRALRLRPVPADDSDHVGAVKKFMATHLKLSQSFMDSVGEFTVRRVPFGPAARVKDEVIVAFQSTDVRDAVKSSARNLAGMGSDYGVRLELPDHLKSAMKALQAVSYEVKKKYPQARRNVLFDDETMDLVLDFCTSEGA